MKPSKLKRTEAPLKPSVIEEVQEKPNDGIVKLQELFDKRLRQGKARHLENLETKFQK